MERPISSLKVGARFTVRLEGWGKYYGEKHGVVKAQGLGSTTVEWDSGQQERTFRDCNGVMATILYNKKEISYVCKDTPVIKREQ